MIFIKINICKYLNTVTFKHSKNYEVGKWISFLLAAVTNDHKLSGLTHEFILIVLEPRC